MTTSLDRSISETFEINLEDSLTLRQLQSRQLSGHHPCGIECESKSSDKVSRQH